MPDEEEDCKCEIKKDEKTGRKVMVCDCPEPISKDEALDLATKSMTTSDADEFQAGPIKDDKPPEKRGPIEEPKEEGG